jgi:hypothetical protein
MGYSNSVPRIEIVASSGMLRVTIHPRGRWLLLLAEIAVSLIFAEAVYRGWAAMQALFRVLVIWGLVGSAAALIYQLSGTEIIEFDEQRLTVCKEIHGWERKKEYPLAQCNEFGWASASENRRPGLTCKVGWRTVRLGIDLSEAEANEILVALQQTCLMLRKRYAAFQAARDTF